MSSNLADDLDILLREVCVDLGFCVGLCGADLVQEHDGLTAQQFAYRVLMAEKMNPNSEPKWVDQLEDRFKRRYGAEVSKTTFKVSEPPF